MHHLKGTRVATTNVCITHINNYFLVIFKFSKWENYPYKNLIITKKKPSKKTKIPLDISFRKFNLAFKIFIVLKNEKYKKKNIL